MAIDVRDKWQSRRYLHVTHYRVECGLWFDIANEYPPLSEVRGSAIPAATYKLAC